MLLNHSLASDNVTRRLTHYSQRISQTCARSPRSPRRLPRGEIEIAAMIVREFARGHMTGRAEFVNVTATFAQPFLLGMRRR